MDILKDMLSTEKLEPIPVPNAIKNNFLDTYVLEFLSLPEKFSEHELKNNYNELEGLYLGNWQRFYLCW